MMAILKALLSLCLVFSLWGPAQAQMKQAASNVDPQPGISLPDSLGPLKRQGMKKYDQPGLGISYRYEAAPLMRADIFIYDLGKKNLGTGINSPEVKAHFAQVKDEIYQMEKLGRYRSVQQVSAGETALGSPSGKIPALAAVFTYSQAPGPGVTYEGGQISHLLLTTYKGTFIKVRFSYPDKQQKQGERAWQQFLTDLGRTLK